MQIILRIIIFLCILFITFFIISYTAETRFIRQNRFRKRNKNTHNKIIYSYGLFSNEPMSPQMKNNIKANFSLTGMQHEILGYNDVLNDMKFFTVLTENRDFKTYAQKLKETYEMIPRGVSKADLARLIHLYVRGGHYADLDVKFKQVPIVANDEMVILYTENYALRPRIANYAIASSPRHLFILKVIDEIIRRVHKKKEEKDEWDDDDVLQTTGPDVITDVYRSWNGGGVKRIGLINSKMILTHEAEGTWRANRDGV